MWRDADTEARDLKSKALIAERDSVRSIYWLLKGAESLALRALAAALRVWRDYGGVRECTDEIFTIRPPVRRVNAEVRTSFVGHHINATPSGAETPSRPQPTGSSEARALTATSTARR
jgi:hypothetical protein